MVLDHVDLVVHQDLLVVLVKLELLEEMDDLGLQDQEDLLE